MSDTKISSNWIRDLNIRPEAIKLLKETIGAKTLGISLVNDFLNLIPQAKATKEKTSGTISN